MTSPTHIGRRSRARERRVDVGIIAGLVVLVLCVHPLGTMLRRPFWLDEAWVAELANAPFSRQVDLSSVSPIGWIALLRLVPGDAEQRFRVVPLMFSAATAVLTYLLVRGLHWRNHFEARCAGVIATAAVVLAPMSLRRNDLKQYTSDAAFALLILVLARNADRDYGRRPLVLLGIAGVVVMPFSTVAGLVTIAVFAGLIGSATLHKSFGRAREVLVCGAAAGTGIASYMAVVVLPHQHAQVRTYWREFYLTGTPWDVWSTVWDRVVDLKSLGGPSLVVFALFGFGLVLLSIRGHVALAIAAVVLWLEMFLCGVVSRYPFLDQRTSYFLLVVTVVIAVDWCGRAGTRGRPPQAFRRDRHCGRTGGFVGVAIAS